MKTGISTACFYPENTEIALFEVAEIGANYAEVFFNSFSELTPDFIKKLKKIAQEHQLKIVSLHPFTSGYEPFLFFSEYRRRFEDGMELYKQYYECANLLGAEIVVFHGQQKESALSYDQVIERYAELYENAKKYGIKLAHENVQRCVGCKPAFFKRLLELVPTAPLVFDIKQAVRAGYDPYDFFEVMQKNICHVHVSDHTAQKSCLPVGEGIFSFEKLYHALRQNHFHGVLVEELYRSNFSDRSHLEKSYNRLRQLVEKKA